MNDEETVALIAGGHSFGKTHGAGAADKTRPGARGLPARGAGPGLEEPPGPATARTPPPAVSRSPGRTPTTWDNPFFENLFGHEWELTKSPAGAHQWVAKDAEATVPDAHARTRSTGRRCSRPTCRCGSTRRTRRSRGASGEPGRVRAGVREGLVQAAAPRHGSDLPLLGPWVPEPQLWQDPVPAVDEELIGDEDSPRSRPSSWTRG